MSDENEADPWDANPGFRTLDLSDDAAYDAIHVAADKLATAALAARYDLLSLGFAADHSVCEELDATARHYTDMLLAVRVQRHQREVAEREKRAERRRDAAAKKRRP